MRDGNWGLRTSHTLEENRLRLQISAIAKRPSKLFRLVLRKFRPCLSAGMMPFKVTHHLATITNTEAEAIRTMEEFRELIRHHGIEQDGFAQPSPAPNTSP